MSVKSVKKSFVSRSVYQKLAEENKRLLKDLRVICMNPGIEALTLRMHWRNRFKKEDKFWSDVQSILRKEISKGYKSGIKSTS